jgi:DNA mismatch endonuclease (patch repair protein)
MKRRDREQASLPDPLTPEQRRLCMSRIRATDTRPEMIIRRGLHALGLRYRLHDRDLPGTPDLVFPGARAVIFVHGCFWHGHHCPLFRLPATRTGFWAAKIDRNRVRDAEAQAALRTASWHTLTIWECALRGRARLPQEELLGQSYGWVTGMLPDAEITGAWDAIDS